ncbi:hypothetical protein MTR_8g078080 [Medicago truncatula]|uniref:Uncharacterized protein n=1 Tax=Medicago truncatula TaxID=3880 RepID=G7LEW2_MEDTR|nr:hypothetical protein MTR_8g078080 [Medicago truncatula]
MIQSYPLNEKNEKEMVDEKTRMFLIDLEFPLDLEATISESVHIFLTFAPMSFEFEDPIDEDGSSGCFFILDG